MRRLAAVTAEILVVAIAAIVCTRLLGVHGVLAVVVVGVFVGLFGALIEKLANHGDGSH